MSIATQIERLQNAKESLKAKLIAKGVTVSKNAKLNECVDLVDEISSSNNGGTSLNAFLLGKKSCYCLFYGYEGETVESFFKYDDTKNVENMSGMFSGCLALTKVPLFDTSKVTDMSEMFDSCTALTEIPLLDTSNVINMNNMFDGCSALTKVPLLDTSNVETMGSMFSGCGNLTEIPLLDTSKVTLMTYMFSNCSALTKVPALNTSKVTDMNTMFGNCSALTEVPLLDTSNVETMNMMFSNCSALTEVPAFDTSKVTDMNMMFKGCHSLTEVPALNTSKVTNMSSMFANCLLINKIDISYFNFSTTTKTSGWCTSCYNLKAIIIRSFGSYRTINSNAFNYCYHLLGTVNSFHNPNGDKDCYIYVPSAMVNTLKSATNWSKYADQIRALESYTVDGTTTGELDEAKAGIS